MICAPVTKAAGPPPGEGGLLTGECRGRGEAGKVSPRWEGCREPQVGFEPTTARLRIECSTPELLWPINSAGAHVGAPPIRCPGADSNRDAFRHYPLKIACLPVSPPGRAAEQDSRRARGGQPLALDG